MYRVVMNKIDKDLDRRVLGFKVAGYDELKLVEDTICLHGYLDIYCPDKDELEKEGLIGLYEADCLAFIHVPKRSSYDEDEYFEMIEADVADFIKDECREEVVEEILATAKNYDKGEGMSFQYDAGKSCWVLGRKYKEAFDDGHVWEETLVEPVGSYNYLTDREVEKITEKLDAREAVEKLRR